MFEDAEFICNNGIFVVERKVEKMSKRWYNVVNPDLICEEYGADSLRLFEMFLGPLEQYKPWNTSGIVGTHNFLKKLWKLYVDESGIKVKNIKPELENLKNLFQPSPIRLSFHMLFLYRLLLLNRDSFLY